jgi:NADPH-dependent curcumin reductase CurA
MKSYKSRKLRALKFADSVKQGAEIIEDEINQLADNQVLIKNRYAGVNGLFDRAIIRNEVPYRFLQPPLDMGVEAIGTVIEIGKNVKKLKIGDYVSTTRFGQGYREYQIEDEAKVWKINDLNPEYVALRPTAVSALVALEQVGQMKSGELVAVSAAAGGLGQFVVQFAKMAGNQVIGICGGNQKVNFLNELRCDFVIDYKTQNVGEILKKEFPNGVNLIYDTVGGELFDQLVDNLAIRGRLIVSGYAADMGQSNLPESVTRPRIYEQIYWKAAQIRCFQNALYTEFHDDASQRILEWYHAGKLKVKLDERKFIGLESVFDAIEYLCSGQSLGKVVLDFEE